MVHQQEPTREQVVFKTIGEIDLVMHIFKPAVRKPLPASAIIFFFGGGWRNGTPAQFFPHCEYFASRGMVAFSAEYRVKNRHNVTPFACVADGKSAMRWVRKNAEIYGVDVKRVVGAGGSAGGHVAACTALVQGYDQKDEDMSVSSVPDALVLFNPVLDTTQARFIARFEGNPLSLSPQHNIRAELPPTIIFHGKADTTVPYAKAEIFTALMREAGNRCELVGFEGKTHGFFNYGRGDGTAYIEAVRAADIFMTSSGFLEGEPTI
jgi:acetyl esterase/lipase